MAIYVYYMYMFKVYYMYMFKDRASLIG